MMQTKTAASRRASTCDDATTKKKKDDYWTTKKTRDFIYSRIEKSSFAVHERRVLTV
jgi:hypothetical protein